MRCITSFLWDRLGRCEAAGQQCGLFSEFHAVQYWNCREENIDSLVLCHRPCRRSYRLSDGGFAGHAFPKAVGIAVAVVLRFFPTIYGEYRAIRSSQRFRGIGVGVVHTLTHLPSTVEYILIPLILRTTKVAEELSASMTVRGVRFPVKLSATAPSILAGRTALFVYLWR